MSTASGLDLARLQIVFDTTTAPVAINAMQQVVSQSRNVGHAIDQQTVKQREQTKAAIESARALEQLGVAHAAAASGYKRGSNDGAAYARTVMDIKRALDEEAKAAAMVASGHQQRAAAISRLMVQARADYQAGTTSAKQYADQLSKLQVEMNKIAAPQQVIATAGREAAGSMTLLTGAFGGFFGVLGFQALSGLTQFATFLTGLPGDLASAGDQFERLNARITFAFRGSGEAARAARQDMISMARETGVPLSQVSQSYGDLAIAGRGPGLSRSQIGGLVSGFSTLGAMTGADNASTGRAMWQFQQALALGRLTSQDYRFMATNMPAIDDALAAGMGVDVNTIPGRISRGEIDANRMVDALIRGVEILRETSGGIPETMERARGRIQTEWELLLTNLEERVQSSPLYQQVMGGVSRALGDVNVLMNGSPEEQLALRLRQFENNPSARNPAMAREIERLQGIIDDPGYRRASERARMAEQRREQEVQRNAILGRGLQAADSAFSLDLQRSDIQTSITQIERAMGVAGAANAPAEDVERLARALTAFRTQLSRLVSVAERRLIDVQNAERDFQRYGAGGGFDMAQQARSLAEQAAVQGRPIGEEAALNIIRRERRLGIDRDLAGRVAGSADRQIIVDAAGLDAAARRRAALDAEMAAWQRDNPAATQDQVAAYRTQRQTEFQQGDAQSLAERARADADRLSALRVQLELGLQLGQQGRIALAQAERERELRREFPDLTAAQLRAERARVAENVRLSEELAFQQRQLELLADSARTAGAAIGDALSAGILQGVRSGQDGVEAALASLQRSAERILSNLLTRITAPWERRIEEMVAGPINNWFANDNDPAREAVKALGDAATQAGGALADSMAPSIAEAATKTAIATAVTEKQIGAQAAATSSLLVFTKAVEAAAAAASGSSAGGIADAIVGAFTGGMGGGHSGGQIPGGGGKNPVPTGKLAPGGAATSIMIIDQRSGGDPVQTKETKGSNGERQIQVFIRDAIKQNVANGELNGVMQSQFGAAPAMRKV